MLRDGTVNLTDCITLKVEHFQLLTTCWENDHFLQKFVFIE